eukprot:c27698_g1_i1 orf=979-1689(-)
MRCPSLSKCLSFLLPRTPAAAAAAAPPICHSPFCISSSLPSWAVGESRFVGRFLHIPAVSHFGSCESGSSSAFWLWCRMHSSAAASTLDSLEDDDRGPFSDKILRLSEEIAGLTDNELVQMSAALRKKLGIPEPSSMMGVGMPMGMGGWQDVAAMQEVVEEKPVEKTAFEVKLVKFDAPQKIKVIKEVRVVTSLGLKEAKELVEKTPAVLKTGVGKEEALQIIDKLNAVGATVTME